MAIYDGQGNEIQLPPQPIFTAEARREIGTNLMSASLWGAAGLSVAGPIGAVAGIFFGPNIFGGKLE